MEIDADPVLLRYGSDRLTMLSAELMAAAQRLCEVVGGERRVSSGDVAWRCAVLVAGLRADAAELADCSARLRADSAGLLAGETEAVLAVAEVAGRLGDVRRSGRDDPTG